MQNAENVANPEQRPRAAPLPALAIGLTPASPIRQLFRFFRSGESVWSQLERQANLVHEEAAAYLTEGSPNEARDTISRTAAEGELTALELETRLRLTLLVPLDREDLHRLSSMLSTAQRLTAHARHPSVTGGIAEPSSDRMRALQELLVDCALQIVEAVGHLRRREYGVVTERSRALRRLRHTAELAHDEGLSELLRDEASSRAHVLVRNKTLLDDVMSAIRQCAMVGSCLAYLAAKNG